MIFRVSIDARDPCRVAAVLAELVGGRSVRGGAGWLVEASQAAPQILVVPREDPCTDAGHCSVTLATSLDIAEVYAIAGREGWPARYRRRASGLDVIELMLEGARAIEVVTPDMQADHLGKLAVSG